MSRPRTARTLMFALLIVMTAAAAHAQDVRHRNFELDTVFRIGCHLLQLPRLAHDSLSCEFSQFYITDLADVRRQILTPTNWFDSLVRDFYLNADDSTLDYKVIFNLSHFADLYHRARAVDQYPWIDQVVQGYNFPGINATQGTIDSVGPAALLGALRIPRVSSPTTVLMAQGTRYVSTEGFFTGDSARYARWGLDNDSTHFIKIVVALDVPTADLGTLDSTDTLVYVDLYRRIDTLQSEACRCNLYEKFRMLPVTKSAYLDAPFLDESETYREVTFWLDMRGGRYLDTTDSMYYHSRRGSWFGYPTDRTQCTQSCQDLLLKLRDTLGVVDTSAIHFPVTPEQSDLTCRVYTTRKATVSLFRVRFAMHALDALERGDLDDWLRADLDTLFDPQDTVMSLVRRRLMRLGIHDEPYTPVFRQVAIMSTKMQDFLDDVSSNDRRGLFQNTTSNFDGWRLFTGDLDTSRTRPKPAHMICRQLYVNIPSLIPSRYANPDSMDDKALATYYRVTDATLIWGSDTIDAPKRLALNTRADYDRYTREQDSSFGAYFDHTTVATQTGGVIVPHLARAVHVGRGKYSTIGADSCLVWNVVQAAGWFKEAAFGLDPRGYSGVWSLLPPTAEMITAQTFLTLNCGADGLLWHDIQWDGANFGICDWRTGDHAKEYDSGFTGNHPVLQGDPKWTLPKMWTGFASRFRAVQRVGRELTERILPVYNRLQRPGYQISVFDTRQSFGEIPMIDTLIARRAIVDSLDGSGGYIDAGTADTRDSTYIELTVFQPKAWYDTGIYRNSRYALITNRRTFPNDTLRYSSRTTALGGDSVGLGFIDVRRPVVVIKNTTTVIADSIRVERIGDTTWSVVAPFGQEVDLEWLEPGWGHMYRLTPIACGVSSLGTAFNNAQHAENPSLDTGRRPIITVYERDSVVYMRLNHRDGSWSHEVMISDSADTVTSTRAWNITPAVAVIRPGSGVSSAMIVWERRAPGETANPMSSIQALYFCARPDTGTLPPATRVELDSSQEVPESVLRTPSVVGTDSGYCVAWGSPTGIRLVAIRDTVLPTTGWSSYVSLTKTVVAPGVQVRMPPSPAVALDSLSLFPSLAYVRNYQTVFGPTPTHDVYLAWQQGGGSSGVGPFIFFKPINLRFTPGQKPTVGTGAPIEHVTRGLPGCQFYHPCIAADTLRVAVAFDSPFRMYWRWDQAMAGNPPHVVTLRFRDSLTTTGQILRRWNTPAYTWAKWGKTLLYPSVVQFPNVPKTTLRSAIPGGVTWFSQDSDDLLYLYRYGEGGLDTSLRGTHPTMIRSPYTAVSDAWSTSGILTRAREADGFTDASPFGYDAEYFPAELINTPATPSALFTDDAPRTGGIFAHFVLSKLDSSFLEDCDIPSIISGVYDPHGWKDFDGGGDLFIGAGRLVSTIGPTFFAEPDSGTTIIDSPAAVGRVARTGNFPAIEGGVTVMWGAQRNDALIDMLDLAPYDSLLDDSADVLIRLELVRASDDSVLWQSDPVSARTLSTEPVGYATEIAADSLAGTDTMVYARLSVYVSPEVDMEVSTGYQFIDKPDTYFPRRVRHAVDAEGNTIDLTLTAVPNPARSSDVRITLQSETVPDGAASLTLYDARGAEVADLGALTIREGVGSGLLRVDQLRAGVYVLVARVRQRIASARVTVVR